MTITICFGKLLYSSFLCLHQGFAPFLHGRKTSNLFIGENVVTKQLLIPDSRIRSMAALGLYLKEAMQGLPEGVESLADLVGKYDQDPHILMLSLPRDLWPIDADPVGQQVFVYELPDGHFLLQEMTDTQEEPDVFRLISEEMLMEFLAVLAAGERLEVQKQREVLTFIRAVFGGVQKMVGDLQELVSSLLPFGLPSSLSSLGGLSGHRSPFSSLGHVGSLSELRRRPGSSRMSSPFGSLLEEFPGLEEELPEELLSMLADEPGQGTSKTFKFPGGELRVRHHVVRVPVGRQEGQEEGSEERDRRPEAPGGVPQEANPPQSPLSPLASEMSPPRVPQSETPQGASVESKSASEPPQQQDEPSTEKDESVASSLPVQEEAPKLPVEAG